MPRRKKKSFKIKREIGVDPLYHSELIQKFINVIMSRGKKNIARSIVYDALDVLSKKIGKDKGATLEFFRAAFEKVIPLVEVRPRRVGGSVYQIPIEVPENRARALALRWIIRAATARSDKNMGKRLASELLDAHEGRGGAVKKKVDVYKMAESNRAFSHYAW